MFFVVNLTYQRPLPEVNANLEAHRNFLLQHYAKGHFLASGPKSPRTGGVILASADSPQQLEAWLLEDPFRQNGIATYEVITWTPTLAARGLASTLKRPPAAASPDICS